MPVFNGLFSYYWVFRVLYCSKINLSHMGSQISYAKSNWIIDEIQSLYFFFYRSLVLLSKESLIQFIKLCSIFIRRMFTSNSMKCFQLIFVYMQGMYRKPFPLLFWYVVTELSQLHLRKQPSSLHWTASAPSSQPCATCAQTRVFLDSPFWSTHLFIIWMPTGHCLHH